MLRKLLTKLMIKKQGTLIFCPYCKSANVSFSESTISKSQYFLAEQYKVKCNDCLSKGFVTESWEIKH